MLISVDENILVFKEKQLTWWLFILVFDAANHAILFVSIIYLDIIMPKDCYFQK